jgi:hypothetical protein
MFIEDVISNETTFRDAGPFASSLDCALKNNVSVSPEKEINTANSYSIQPAFPGTVKRSAILGKGMSVLES